MDSVTEVYLRHNFISILWLKMLQLIEQSLVTAVTIYTRTLFITRQRRLLASSDPGKWLTSHWLQFHETKTVFTKSRHVILVNLSQVVSLNEAAPSRVEPYVKCSIQAKEIWCSIKKALSHLLTHLHNNWDACVIYLSMWLFYWENTTIDNWECVSVAQSNRRPSSTATHCPTLAQRLLLVAICMNKRREEHELISARPRLCSPCCPVAWITSGWTFVNKF